MKSVVEPNRVDRYRLTLQLFGPERYGLNPHKAVEGRLRVTGYSYDGGTFWVCSDHGIARA